MTWQELCERERNRYNQRIPDRQIQSGTPDSIVKSIYFDGADLYSAARAASIWQDFQPLSPKEALQSATDYMMILIGMNQKASLLFTYALRDLEMRVYLECITTIKGYLEEE